MRRLKRVLVVDDTKNIRLLLTKCLELEGYEVETASNGQEGYEKICGGVYNLVFLDIKLPELSGTEVLRRIRAQGIPTPVIIITAYPTVKNAVECTQLGSIAYLQKPFTADRLRAVLNQLAAEAQERRAGSEEIQQLLDAHRYREALDRLKGELSRHPDSTLLYRMLAETYEGLGDSTSADQFRKAGRAFE